MYDESGERTIVSAPYEPRLVTVGSGPPLVLVPGLDGTGLLFYRQVPHLTASYTVGTFRLRDRAERMETLVADLDVIAAAVVDAARRDGAPGKVTLVGESFGGALALSYALAHPDRVERLVIVNSFPYFGPQLRLWLGYHLLRALPWGVMPLVRQLTARRLHSRHTGPVEIRTFHALMRATTRGGYLSRLAILRQYDLRPCLSRLNVPLLLLAADGDRLVPAVRQAQLMASLAPQAVVQILNGHGHICLIAPDLSLADILQQWIATADAPPTRDMQPRAT